MTETEQGSHSELGLPAKRKMPDSRDGRYTHRPAVPPPADDICQCVKLRYGILNPLWNRAYDIIFVLGACPFGFAPLN